MARDEIPSVESDDGSVSGVGDWGVIGERRGGNDRGGLEDRRGVGDRGCCDEWTLHGHLIGVGVAGGDRDGVGDRYCRRRRDDRGRVKSWCGQVAGFRCGRGAGQQSEECHELVHDDRWLNCFVLRSRSAEERMMLEHGV